MNVSKGPAVHSLRAQADKAEYSRAMRQVLENTDHLSIVQGEVTEIMVENGAVTGVQTIFWCYLPCESGNFVYRNLLKSTLYLR